MGRAARRKREQRQAAPRPVGRPRWEGADGFDYAWRLTNAYVTAAEELFGATSRLDKAQSIRTLAGVKVGMLDGQAQTLDSIVASLGGPRRAGPASTPMEPVFPGEFDVEADVEKHRPYAIGLHALATSVRDTLAESTPILFDPLSTPELAADAAKGVRLPFQRVCCDFLNAQGMSMPVTVMNDRADSEWVGLVAAVLEQQADDVVDVWPFISTLHPAEGDDRQKQRTLMFGRVRFGAELPDPPEGVRRLNDGEASVWVLDMSDKDEGKHWAALWIVVPALAALTALRLLDAVNVNLQPANLSRAQRRRAARDGADVPMEVVIRTTRRESAEATPSGPIDWQHRWTVRGHWKHFHKGPIFNANPRRRVIDADGQEVVKVWCPPFVKGPDDKPLVLKARRLA